MQQVIDQFVERSLLTNDLLRTESHRWFLDHAAGVFTKWLDPEGYDAFLMARERMEVGQQRGIFPRLLEEPQLVDSAGIYECKWQLVPGRLLKTLSPAEARVPEVSADLAKLFFLTWQSGLLHGDASYQNIIAVDTTSDQSKRLFPFVFIDLEELAWAELGDQHRNEMRFVTDYCRMMFNLWAGIDLDDFAREVHEGGLSITELLQLMSIQTEYPDTVEDITPLAVVVAQLCNLQSHIAPALLNLVMSGLPDKHSLSVADLEKIAN